MEIRKKNINLKYLYCRVLRTSVIAQTSLHGIVFWALIHFEKVLQFLSNKNNTVEILLIHSIWAHGFSKFTYCQFNCIKVWCLQFRLGTSYCQIFWWLSNNQYPFIIVCEFWLHRWVYTHPHASMYHACYIILVGHTIYRHG